MTNAARRIRPPGWLAEATAGFSAIGVKELRGRMRGKRAFVIVTVYLTLMALFAWMVLIIAEANAQFSFGGFTPSQIGQQLFIALMLLETLLVPFLAPALTASAISLEREKQTLDMLRATPISSLGLVLGKLFSALTYIFLLIFASIPLTALVFVFGGVDPEDLIRAYVVLVVSAIGFGSIGLFFSALVQRTQAATVLTYFVVFAVTMGAIFLWVFLMATGAFNRPGVVQDIDRPPEALLYLNPFVSQADVFCRTEADYGTFCSAIEGITGQPSTVVGAAVDAGVGPIVKPIPVDGSGRLVDPNTNVGGGLAVGQVIPRQQRDTFWPKATIAWIVVSVVLIGLSVRLVAPARRRRGRRQPAARPPWSGAAGSSTVAGSGPSEAPGTPAAETTAVEVTAVERGGTDG